MAEEMNYDARTFFFVSFALFSSAFFQLDFVFYLQSDLNESGEASTWESQDKLP